MDRLHLRGGGVSPGGEAPQQQRVESKATVSIDSSTSTGSKFTLAHGRTSQHRFEFERELDRADERPPSSAPNEAQCHPANKIRQTTTCGVSIEVEACGPAQSIELCASQVWLHGSASCGEKMAEQLECDCSPLAPLLTRSSLPSGQLDAELAHSTITKATSETRLPVFCSDKADLLQYSGQLLNIKQPDRQDIGSLSDSSHNRLATLTRQTHPTSVYERLKLREKVTSWKRANKLIAHSCENPFSLHLDCLERLNPVAFSESLESGSETLRGQRFFVASDTSTAREEIATGQSGAEDKKSDGSERLHKYADRLSFLYRKNQRVMDGSSDFRSLLYDVICCLLKQEDQVLATPSVGNLLVVIRLHLESVASCSRLAQPQHTIGSPRKQPRDNQRRASISSSDASSSATTGGPQHQENCLSSSGATRQPRRPADYGRVSSMSYNDKQLVDDLWADKWEQEDSGAATTTSGRSGSLSSALGRDSPWAYEALSAERRYTVSGAQQQQQQQQQKQQQYTSQSSLEAQMKASQVEDFHDPMNDSGNGTMHEYNARRASSACDSIAPASGADKLKRPFSSAPNCTLNKLPNYLTSTAAAEDSYSHLSFNEELGFARASLTCDDDHYATSSCALIRSFRNLSCGHNESEPAENATGRRAELEWTLNRLINYELKQTWLTSNDTLKRAIRKVGVPNEIRGKVWLVLIEQMVGNKYDAPALLEEAKRTIELAAANESVEGHQMDEETQSIMKQIELDVNRTMPGHRLFDDGAEGGVKLRRILVAYSIHINRAIGKLPIASIISFGAPLAEKLTTRFDQTIGSILPGIQLYRCTPAQCFRRRRGKGTQVSGSSSSGL